MLRCTDNSLYTGITNDFEKRLLAHMNKDKSAAKYTKSRGALGIEALWTSADRSSASKLEYHIKKLTKAKKEELVKNPELVKAMGLKEKYDIIENF